MGYYTRFNLEVTKLENAPKDTLTLEEVIEKGEAGVLTQAQMLNELKLIKQGTTSRELSADEVIAELRSGNEYAQYAFDESGNAEENCKWYDHDSDLKEFSKKYPTWLFTLSGEGEEAGDMWRKYYLNGRCQEAKAQINYSPFDMDKLK